MRPVRDLLPTLAGDRFSARAIGTGSLLLPKTKRRSRIVDLVVRLSSIWTQNSVPRIGPRIDGEMPTRAAKNIESP